jgi:hypothetical protein
MRRGKVWHGNKNLFIDIIYPDFAREVRESGLGEGTFLQLIVDGTNVLNHPKFGGETANTNNGQTPTFQPGIGYTGFGTLPVSSNGDPRFILIGLKPFF